MVASTLICSVEHGSINRSYSIGNEARMDELKVVSQFVLDSACQACPQVHWVQMELIHGGCNVAHCLLRNAEHGLAHVQVRANWNTANNNATRRAAAELSRNLDGAKRAASQAPPLAVGQVVIKGEARELGPLS